MQLYCWPKGSNENPQITQGIVSLSSQTDKAQLQKTIRTELIEHAEGELLPIKNLHLPVLVFLVLEGPQQCYQKRNVNTFTNHLFYLQNTLDQQWHKNCKRKQKLSDLT